MISVVKSILHMKCICILCAFCSVDWRDEYHLDRLWSHEFIGSQKSCPRLQRDQGLALIDSIFVELWVVKHLIR